MFRHRANSMKHILVALVLLRLSSAQPARFVVTFETVDMRLQALPPEYMRVVKSYGRRLVLSVDDVTLDDMVTIWEPWAVEVDEKISSESEASWDNVNYTSVSNTPSEVLWGETNDTSVADTQSEDVWGNANDTPGSSAQWPLDAIHVLDVWNETRGDNTTLIAVLDSGLPSVAEYRFQDLRQGYDFISDPTYSLDGDGRDPEWHDPGDAAADCPTSSWHGLRVTSLIAAVPEPDDDAFQVHYPTRLRRACCGSFNITPIVDAPQSPPYSYLPNSVHKQTHDSGL